MSENIREVVIEILRHGPAHNQLLSPLTRYLALCGSHPAVSLSVPFEHRVLEHLLSRMSYPDGLDPKSEAARDRAFAHEQLSKAVTGLLEQIPALPHEGRVGNGALLHLRLMTTPQELAMLPFELADPPSGFQSGGQPFLIGPTPNVVLTREVRRSSSVRVRVPPKPKVLVIFADPWESGIPSSDTLRAIATAIRPWGRPNEIDGKLTMDLGAHLVVLERASLDEIREHCVTGRFTHVHILAHGAKLDESSKEGVGLALWDRQKEGEEVVDGLALARALRPPQEDGSWACPWSVVLCTCDSGKIGSVVHPNASIAHALHVAGIPFVLASQYPLTYGAATSLAQTLYPLELGGEDPRHTLSYVRHVIASYKRQTHDWASLVAYAGWPSDVGQQLEEIRVIRAFDQLEATQAWADHVIAKADRQDDDKTGRQDNSKAEADILTRSLALVKAANDRLQREAAAKERQLQDVREIREISKHERQHLLSKVTGLLTEIYGLLGSASKRRARLHAHQNDEEEAKNALREAARWYLKGVALQAPEHWTPCQSFVLLGLGSRDGGWADGSEKNSAKENWRIASQNAHRALNNPSELVWAYGTLIEVELWRPFLGMPEGATQKELNDCKAESLIKAKEYLRKLVERARPEQFPVKSTVRQLRRYREWWSKANYLEDGLLERVEELLSEVTPNLLAVEDEMHAKLEIDLPESIDRASDRVKTDEILGSGRVKSIGGDDESSMATLFRVQMLPARQGDALWIEYGNRDDPHRILIDGGFRTTIRTVEKRIRKLAKESPTGKCHFELGVVSHIDADHIEGIIEMVGRPLPVSFGDLWFNGRKHLDLPAIEASLADENLLGGKHGLFLDTALELNKTPWNRQFKGGTIVVSPEPKDLPIVQLPGDMKLTIMSPTPAKLETLAKRWDREVRKAGLDGANYRDILDAMDKLHFSTDALADELLRRKKPTGPIDIEELIKTPDGADESPANGSSIAFLAEHAGRSCLFMADAHPDAMLDAINRMVGENERLRVGAVKLSHHGSGNNVTLELLKRIDSHVFLVSTDGGGGHYHPDRHAMAKLIAGDWRPIGSDYPITILFNYRSDYTKIWDDEALMQRFDYTVEYADHGDILELAPVPKTPV